MTQGGARQKRRGLTRWGEVGLHPPGRCRTAHHRPASEEPATPSHRGGRRPGSTNAPREQPSGPQTVRAEGHGLAAPPQGLSWGSSGRTWGRWPFAAQVTLGRGPPCPASDAGKSLCSPPARPRPRGLVLWPDLFSPSLTSRL